jgi:hypothetical protein
MSFEAQTMLHQGAIATSGLGRAAIVPIHQETSQPLKPLRGILMYDVLTQVTQGNQNLSRS